MNRGIDKGKDLPREVLEEIYNSIEKTPFKIPDDEGGLAYTFVNPERDGFLTKEGRNDETALRPGRRQWLDHSPRSIALRLVPKVGLARH